MNEDDAETSMEVGEYVWFDKTLIADTVASERCSDSDVTLIYIQMYNFSYRKKRNGLTYYIDGAIVYNLF